MRLWKFSFDPCPVSQVRSYEVTSANYEMAKVVCRHDREGIVDQDSKAHGASTSSEIAPKVTGTSNNPILGVNATIFRVKTGAAEEFSTWIRGGSDDQRGVMLFT